MVRSIFAIVCWFVSLLAMSAAAFAEPPCSGIVITDVIETVRGELTSVGERCYERGPGVPFYYDAPGKSLRSVEPASSYSVPSSVTRFESSQLEALGAQSIEDLSNPFPPGQGEADLRPE